MSSTPPEAYEAARERFNVVAFTTARALEERAAGQSYTLNFGPIVDRVVDAVVPIIRRQVADEIRSTIVPGAHMPTELQPTGGVANTRALTAEWAAKIALGTDTPEDA